MKATLNSSSRPRAAAIAAVTASALWAAAPAVQAQTPMTAEQARAVVAPFYQALNAGNDALALIQQSTTTDWESCGANDDCKPRDKAAPAIAGFSKAVPDLKWEIKEIVATADRIVVRGEGSGTPAGAFMGVPHGGKSFRIMAIDIHYIADGKIRRSYHVEDWMGAARQLSAK